MESASEPVSEPMTVHANDAGVDLATPDGRTLTLTREAAIASAKRLLQAAGADRDEETYQKPWG